MRASAAAPYVLMYHSVDHYEADPYHITVTPERFAAQMAWLAGRGLRGVSVRELLLAQYTRRARRLVGLTFDDGYADFVTQAVPIMRRHGFTATVFVVAGKIGGVNDWDPDGPRKPLMTAEDLRWAVAEGMEVGSHTVTHAVLASADPYDVERELKTSRVLLEEIVQRQVEGLAYPYGAIDENAVDAARAAGYSYACAIKPPAADQHTLPRTYIGQRDGLLRLYAKRARHRWKWRRGR
ncbi:polysaccharide deacetylase family protein [Thermoactinospora rubra]|uniref:polysaccharide deacetylase family protein n=1 Tax=Thermoactinospora rubra TaxID=1088767 RepID=UPI000A10DF52|nr:polysaccharide deacetylase family protein [Thermoactinospora rubra]